MPEEAPFACRVKRGARERPQPILMTEKDAVKYRDNPPADAWFVPVRVEFDPADAAKLLELVGTRINRS